MQHQHLLLAAQQQSIQHSLLKHILESADLNSRVRGIVAYEEYEAVLREIKNARYLLTAEQLDAAIIQMCKHIKKIYNDEEQKYKHLSEIQKRVIVSIWQTTRELMADENRDSPHFLRTKKIQHCWIHSRLAKGLLT